MRLGRGSIRLIQVALGPENLREALQSVASGATISALSDRRLHNARNLLGDLATDAEFLVMGKLAGVVCRCASVATQGLPRSGQLSGAIAEACAELPKDRPLAPVARFAGLQASVGKNVGLLANWRIDLTHRLEVTDFDRKINDLADVAEGSRQLLRRLGCESVSERIEKVLATPPTSADPPGSIVILIDETLTPLHAEWFRWIAEAGGDVVLIEEWHPKHPNFFGTVSRFLPALKPEVRGEVNALCGELFGSSDAAGALDALTIVAADRLAECEWVLRACQHEISAGKDPASISIYARDLAETAPHLIAAASRLEIPIALSWRGALLCNRLVSFLLELLEACASPDPRKLANPLRSPYAGIPIELRKQLEQALNEAHGNRSDVVAEWAERHEERIAWLPPFLDWREEALNVPAATIEWCERIRTLGEILPFLDLFSDGGTSEREMRAQNAAQGSLADRASIERVANPRTMNLLQAAEWVRGVWETADTSIPSGEEGIQVVGSSDQLPACESLYVLGMVEGAFPRREGQDPILSDGDLEALSTLHELPIQLPSSKLAARREREEFLRICAAPTRRITFSMSQFDGSREAFPSSYLEEVRRVLGPIETESHPRTDIAPTVDRAEGDPDRSLAQALGEPKRLPQPVEFSLPESARTIAWSPERRFKLKDLRVAIACPFQFAFSRTLRLRPQRLSTAWYTLVDLPVEAGLALQPDPEAARNALKSALDRKIAKNLNQIPSWELVLLRLGGERYVEDLVEREFRSRELWPRQADSVQLRVRLGENELVNQAGPGVWLEDVLPALSRQAGLPTIHLYESTSMGRTEARSDGDALYYGLIFMLMPSSHKGGAIEVDSLTGSRKLLMLPRRPNLRSDAPMRLTIEDFSPSDDADGVKQSHRELRKLLQKSVEVARSGAVAPIPSKSNCESCDFGELCRRSALYGESESPFGPDATGARDS